MLEAETKSSSFQLCVVRLDRNQQYYTMGYSIIENGKGIKFEEITHVDLGDIAKFSIDYNEGKVSINTNGTVQIDVSVNLKEIIPFVSVTSGQARFEFQKKWF